MTPIELRTVPLTRKTFEPYGDVIETSGRPFELINEGKTRKFSALFDLDVTADGGSAGISLYRSEPVSLPFPVRQMERHALGSQAFIPLHGRPFPVIVALPSEQPGVGDIAAFMTNGRQGINLARGTWHHFQLTLAQAGDYLVIDRSGPGVNLEEWRLPQVMQLVA